MSCRSPTPYPHNNWTRIRGQVNRTEPVENVRWLYEEKRQQNAIIVSTSDPIPAKGTDGDRDKNPPHREAANYYKEDVLEAATDRFKVTMESPSAAAPRPLVIEIDGSGATVRKRAVTAAIVATSRQAPRAG